MERSWDYLLKTPAGLIFALVSALMVMTFIIVGGIFMRMEMHKQRELRQKLRESQETVNVESERPPIA